MVAAMVVIHTGPATLLPLGQASWTDLSLVFPWSQGFREGFQWEVVSKLNYSASGLIHIQMDWLSNVRETGQM